MSNPFVFAVMNAFRGKLPKPNAKTPPPKAKKAAQVRPATPPADKDRS